MNDLQKKQLEILISIDKLCKDNGLVFYLAGGTAIGAVRHKGFIPWDDDIDIFIKADEYERFKVVFLKSNLTHLVLQENYVDGKYWIFSKIRATGTTQIEREEDKSSAKMQGVFIDIFPLRKCSRSHMKQRVQYYCSQYLTLRSLMEQGWCPKTKKQKIVRSIIRHIANKSLFKYACSYIRKAEENKAYTYYSFFEIGREIPMKKLVYDDSVFQEPVYMEFEGQMFPMATKYDKYLTDFYGDYMTPPPVEKRTQFRHGIFVDVQNDYTKYLSNQRGNMVHDMKWLELYPSDDGCNSFLQKE